MKTIKIYTLITTLFLLTSELHAQTDYYWVGNGIDNTWSNSANWSSTSGGAGGFGIPSSSADNVIFDNLSLNDCNFDSDVDVTNFTINNYTGVLKYLTPSNINIRGSFSMNSGTFDGEGNIGGTGMAGTDIDVASTFSITGSSTFITPLGFLTLKGNVNGGGTLIANIGTTTLFMSASKTLSGGFTFNDLELTTDQSSGSARSLTISSPITVNGNLSITASFSRGININSSTINLKGNLDISGYTTATTFGTQTGIIALNGNTAQSIIGPLSGGQLPSIIINQSSTGGVTMSGNINIAGSWTYISSGSGTVSPGASTVNFVGTTIKNIDGESTGNIRMPFNNLTTSSGSITLTGGLRIDGTGTVNNTVNAQSNTIELKGSFTNGGTFNAANATILITGTNSQSIDLSNGTPNTVSNLTVNKSSNTASITDQLNITSLLTCTSGTLQTNGNIVLISNNTNTAQVANVGGTISGTVNIQRYIPANASRRWRFLAAPITAASGVSIRNGWQAQTFITGAGTGTGPVGSANYNSNGYDWTTSNTPSLYTYDETLSGSLNSRWVSPTTTTGVNLSSGVGYRLFIRGDRSNTGVLDGTVSSQSAVTLSVTGAIPTGNQSVTVSCSNGCGTDDGWNLLGNPYPATIDWNAFQTTNTTTIQATYYILNPNTNAYESWNGVTGGAGRYISSGQSFWVRKSSGGSTSVTFQEAHKATSQNGGSMFKTSNLSNHLALSLAGANFNNKCFIHLNTTGQYAQDNFDAIKFGYANQQIATFVPGFNTRYDINNLPLFGAKTTDTIEVEVNLPATAANYQLSFADVNTFDGNLKLYLQDKLLNTTQDLSTANTYSFATNGSSGSTGNRFRVLITNQNTPLPVVFTALEAKLNDNKSVDLKWSTLTEKNNAKFVVERSTDLTNFGEIGLVKAIGNSNTKTTYTFTDIKAEAYTTNYYRIKQVDFNGKYSYSNIASITTDINQNNIQALDISSTKLLVYPVPTKNRLNIAELEGSVLNYAIFDILGNLVKRGINDINTNGSSLDVEDLKYGIYFIEVKTDSGFIGKTKFIIEN